MRQFVARCFFGSSEHDTTSGGDDPDAGLTKHKPARAGKFLYLITSSVTRNGKSKLVSHVGTSTRPATRIKQHNGELPKGPKATRNTDHPWQFALIYGPYLKHATALRRYWSKKNRATRSRILYGLKIARATQKPAFIDEKQVV